MTSCVNLVLRISLELTMAMLEHPVKDAILVAERDRIKEVYSKRTFEIDPDMYAPWQPGEMLMLFERRRVASEMLVDKDRFPKRGNKCLEIGYGKLGWLSDCIAWGLAENDLYGIELDEKRASVAMAALPSANLIVGDATKMPWDNGFFDLVIISTVLSSITSISVRRTIAAEVDRVLANGGTILIYDTAVRNPRNQDLLPVGRKQVAELFPNMNVASRSVTLAPPISRFVAKHSWALASILSSLPPLRTHRLSLLRRSLSGE